MAMPGWARVRARVCESSEFTRRRFAVPLVASLVAVVAVPAAAASFGSQQVVGGLKVQSIFKGYDGAIYVTFTPSNLAGCNGSYGGYLTSTWSEALVGTPELLDAAKMQLSMLLSAKAMDATLEVRYRVNTAGTGWDKCTIDAIWLQ
jgi:hypothetical protein